MQIIRKDSERAFDEAAAEMILDQMKSCPDSVIALSTGRTTGNMHRLVSEGFRNDPFDISGLTFLAIDEVTGIPDTNPWACRAKLQKEIIGNIGVGCSNFLTLPTECDDIEATGRVFAAELSHRGGIDLLILGLGENGHLGFNQPGTPFDSRIRLSTMDSDLERRIKEDCGLDDSAKLGGITLGIADLMAARKIVLVVKGSSKKAILGKVINGPVTEEVPASILQTHPDCTVLTDDKAG